MDKQSQYWEGRSIQIFEWAQKMNLMAATAIEYDQFAAAIYMHDIRMTFVPHDILNKEGKSPRTNWMKSASTLNGDINY